MAHHVPAVHAVVGSIEGMCCANGHPVVRPPVRERIRLNGHVFVVCQACRPVTRALYALTHDTGALAMRIDVTPAQWHRLLQLPNDSPTTDYLAELAPAEVADAA